MSSFHLLAKPVGPACNLDCRYCFYLEKAALFGDSRTLRMSDRVLDAFVRDYIASQDREEVTFVWQGGEPTLLGITFFEKVLDLQRRYAGEKTIQNAVQTNGTLLDDRWGAFLKRHGFLVGISIDGPRRFHDRHRHDRAGLPTFDRVMSGLRMLQRHGVEYNILTVVSRANVDHPGEVYDFLTSNGARFLQFIPLVGRAGEAGDPADPAAIEVSPETVPPMVYGEFLCSIFDRWVRRDVGRVFVQAFDCALGQWMGLPSSLCVHARDCGACLAIEHNGDVFACDHYVFPSHRRGNILSTPLESIVSVPEQEQFGRDKSAALPRQCRACEYRFACNGGCPKDRFAMSVDGEAGLNWLCPGYYRFFSHIDPVMQKMASLIRSGRPAAEIMQPSRPAAFRCGRNDPCPCGSGQKYKRCCG